MCGQTVEMDFNGMVPIQGIQLMVLITKIPEIQVDRQFFQMDLREIPV